MCIVLTVLKVADALSRQHAEQPEDPEENELCMATSIAIPAWTGDVTASYEGDEHCLKLLQELTLDKDSHPNFSIHSGVLRYKGRIYIGQTTNLKDRIFSSFHSSIFGGHSGSRVTYHRLKQLFYWPGLKRFTEAQVAKCPVCQISKTERNPYPGLLDPLPIPKSKWSEVSMDFVEGLPKARGKDVILVIVDRLTNLRISSP